MVRGQGTVGSLPRSVRFGQPTNQHTLPDDPSNDRDRLGTVSKRVVVVVVVASRQQQQQQQQDHGEKRNTVPVPLGHIRSRHNDPVAMLLHRIE